MIRIEVQPHDGFLSPPHQIVFDDFILHYRKGSDEETMNCDIEAIDPDPDSRRSLAFWVTHL